jgi:uncharacterized SAM-binding protein YcdF (DUF218 family)
LAAIILAGQVVPYLIAPELLLLAADDVFQQWRRYRRQLRTGRWRRAVRLWRPGGGPGDALSVDEGISLTEFVDRYCARVEAAATSDASDSEASMIDVEEWFSRAWYAHIKRLAASSPDLSGSNTDRSGPPRSRARDYGWSSAR